MQDENKLGQELDSTLQSAAKDCGRRYVEAMFPNLEDLEKKAWLQNAVAFGYLRGCHDLNTTLQES